MNSDLIVQQAKENINNFIWKDRHGIFHKPSEMTTHHLYYTILMIWNHTAPEKYKIKPYRSYDFDRFYTVAYFKIAIKALFIELMNRDNIAPQFKEGIMKLHKFVISTGGYNARN